LGNVINWKELESNMFKIFSNGHFKDNDIAQLKDAIANLTLTLSKANIHHFAFSLANVENAAERRSWEGFRRAVLTNELFGGAGALWEVWVEDENLRKAFHEQFYSFMRIVISMGVKDGRVKQIYKSYKESFLNE